MAKSRINQSFVAFFWIFILLIPSCHRSSRDSVFATEQDKRQRTRNSTVHLKDIKTLRLSESKTIEIRPYLHPMTDYTRPLLGLSRLWHQGGSFPANFDILFFPDIFWSIIKIENPYPTSKVKILTNQLPLDKLTIHRIPDHVLKIDSEYLPNITSSKDTDLKHISIEIPPGNSTYLLGFSNANILTVVAPRLMNPEVFHREQFYYGIYLMFFYGGMMGLLIYNFCVVVIAKLWQFSYFLVMAIGFIGTSASLVGLPPEMNFFLNYGGYSLWAFWVTLIVFGASRFSLAYMFGAKHKAKKFHKNASTIINLFPLVGSLFYFSVTFFILIPLMIVFGLILGIFFLIRFGFPRTLIDSILYMINFLPTALIGIYLSGQYMGLIEYHSYSFFILMSVFSINLLFLSLNAASFITKEKVTREKIAQSIELGKNVQKLLYPKEKSAQFGAYRFAFDLRSENGAMLGDWIFYWQTSDKTLHVIMGDVAGKGPHGALIVSAIFMVLMRLKQNDRPLSESFGLINQTLFTLFSGNATTTSTGFSLKNSGEIRVTNCGGIGILHVHGTSIRRHLTEGPILGMMPHIQTSEFPMIVTPGDLLVMATKGIAKNSHQWVGLVKKHIHRPNPPSTPLEICQGIMTLSTPLLAHDKALFVLQC